LEGLGTSLKLRIKVQSIRAALCGTAIYDLYAGWNMIGVPMELTPPSKAYLLGKNLLCLDALNGCYEQVTNIVPGKAYWIFSEVADTFDLDGMIIQDATMNLETGWNFVGPTVDTTLSVDEYVVWEWKPEGYRLPEVVNGQYQLLATKGYWILAP